MNKKYYYYISNIKPPPFLFLYENKVKSIVFKNS